MTRYEVFATRWDDPHIVEELLPARGLSFSMPLSDDGDASFSATVEPGRSLWRAAVGLPLSGILIARDGVPMWSGWVTAERQTGPRTFQFSAKEWGAFFATCPAPQADYLLTNSHDAFRNLVTTAQAVAGQNVQVQTQASTGNAVAGVQVNAWDTRNVREVWQDIADADGGPEWYVGTSGTLANPRRSLVIDDRLGSVDPVDVLHYVEHTAEWSKADGPPGVALLGDLFPAGTTVQPLPRRGGNVLAVSRDRDISRSATQVIATGDGSEVAQLRRSVTASRLRSQGWPLITRYASNGAIGDPDALTRMAQAELNASAGIATRYAVTTFDGDPDWTQVPRGSNMRVVLDTDIYAGPRPYQFTTRVLDIGVDVDDNGGPAQVTWSLAETLDPS